MPSGKATTIEKWADYLAMRSELSLTNMHYPLLVRRLLGRSGLFFAVVMLYALFAALPVTRLAPSGPLLEWYEQQRDAAGGVAPFNLSVGAPPVFAGLFADGDDQGAAPAPSEIVTQRYCR